MLGQLLVGGPGVVLFQLVRNKPFYRVIQTPVQLPEESPQELLQLVSGLEDGLEAAKFAFDEWPYKPHLTLLRNTRCTTQVPLEPILWDIEEFVLAGSSTTDHGTIGAPYLFDRGTDKHIVYEYLRVTGQLMQAEAAIEQVYADPDIQDKEGTSEVLRAQRDRLLARQAQLAPFAEATLQSQVAEAFAELGLATGGQTIPPLLYHTSSTPLALIVSPRDEIVQLTNISILPTLTLDAQIRLEDDVSQSLDVSTLVVQIGGVGVYPTMVMETTDLRWILDTIAHEWAHNYLTLRPLGVNYTTTPELRTMNDIAGRHVRRFEEGLRSAGAHALDWDKRDGQGVQVARGVYVVRLTAGATNLTRKVVVLRR